MKRFRIVSLVLTVAVPLAGCTTTHIDNAVRFPVEKTTVKHRAVSEAGVYKVRWTEESTKEAEPIKGTARLLQPGDRIGFEPQPDGTIVAVAGDERIVLKNIPLNAKLLVWQKREKVPTEFAKGATTFFQAAGTVVGLAALGALYIATSSLEDQNDHGDHNCH